MVLETASFLMAPSAFELMQDWCVIKLMKYVLYRASAGKIFHDTASMMALRARATRPRIVDSDVLAIAAACA
ncbi:hypothetical protein AFL94_17345 [Arthrobacter sp. LS16]|nr:hypothetical protein AFL94_17345 [Arthrobacter sp. LS16]